MKFKIDSKILEQFPGLNIGIVVAKGINNAAINDEIMDLIREESKTIRENFNKETLSANPRIGAWRKAYSSFGAKPKKYKCSVENLYRMILEGIELRHINKIVDIYNYISIKHMIPVGGDDIDKVDGDITLKFALGNEPFTKLNSQEIENPKEGEIVYTDSKEVLCRRWNWRECDKSKMTEDTKNVTLAVEGLPPVTNEEVKTILKELSELVQNFCGGEIKTFVLDNAMPEVEI
jgi:DNA/RNA-binding domain of Phe-tRNA-synthetase-like protein